MEALVRGILTGTEGMGSRELSVFLVSMLPVLELRGGLLASSWLGIELRRAVLICVAGNFLPIPFILLLIRRILAAMKGVALLSPVAVTLERKALGKSDQIRRYEAWGLFLFVAIPLPGTGAWTGALIASLLDMPMKKALPSLLAGLLAAAFLMTILSYGILGNLW